MAHRFMTRSVKASKNESATHRKAAKTATAARE